MDDTEAMKERARERAKELANKLEGDDRTDAWFDEFYRQADGAIEQVPWADQQANALLLDWLKAQPAGALRGKTLVIGCGLGEDAEALASAGFDVTAFDLSPTAIEWAKRRWPASRARYEVADATEPPARYAGAFDFVLESYTLQAVRGLERAAIFSQLPRLLRPGGRLLVICRGRDENEVVEGPPWPLARSELSPLDQTLKLQIFDDLPDPSEREVRRFRAEWVKPGMSDTAYDIDYERAPVPPAPTNPTAPKERHVTIDALRGVAILGILILNVRSFSIPNEGYMYPKIIPYSTADMWAFGVGNVLALGKFISIFAALYGVGIVLSTQRFAASGGSFAFFGRRSGILALVGIAHMMLIWYGDILFMYAAWGLVAFTMRNWRPRWLAVGAVVGFGIEFFLTAVGAVFLIVAVNSGEMKPTDFMGSDPEVWRSTIEAYRGGYVSALGNRVSMAWSFQLIILFALGPQILALMLTGMALFKTGFFTGEWTSRRYVTLGLTAVVIGVGGLAAMTAYTARAGWPIHWVMGWNQAVSVLLNPLTGFGIAALVIDHFAAGRTPWLTNAMAASGRMAFTNYLTQSVIGLIVFVILGQFGYWGYFAQLGFVLAVWAVQIPFSVWWLNRYRFGPLEWLWRAATYGKLPRLRRDQSALASSA